jgi:hypothetical protein
MASIPAPIVVPATIKILPRVLFFTLSSTTLLNRDKSAAQSKGKAVTRQITVTSTVIKSLRIALPAIL